MTLIARKRNKPQELATRNTMAPDLWEELFDLTPTSLFATRLPRVFDAEGANVGMPPMNFAEDEAGYDVTVELPGVNEEEIHVDLLGRQLIVSAERKWTEEHDAKEFHRVESRYGAMSRTMTLPGDARVDPTAIEARCDKGVLHVRFPKVEPTPSRRIEVKHG